MLCSAVATLVILRHVGPGPGAGCEDSAKLQNYRGDAHSGGQRVDNKDLGLKPGPSRHGRQNGDVGAPPTDLQGAAVAEQGTTSI